MTRAIAALAVTAVAGFALGWYFLAGSVSPLPPPGQPKPFIEASHRWPLLAADQKSDRDPPVVAVDAKGRVVVAWSSQTGETERTIFLVRSTDEGDTFEPPTPFRKIGIYRHTTTSKGKEVTRMTSAQPRLTAHGDTILLGWTETVNGGPRVDFLVASSTDGGKTFSEPMHAHGDKAVRTGYTALAGGPDGAFTAAWLDSRNGSQQLFGASAKAGGPAIESLICAGVDGKGVCPCCDVSALRGLDGRAFVAFRHSRDGYRDIYVSRSSDTVPGAFDEPVAVSEDHWKFDGCPHDAPSLALTGKTLHVAWMDAHEGKKRAYLASGGVSDLKFAKRMLGPPPAGEQGHPKLAASDETLYLVYDESLPGGPDAPVKEEHGHGHSHGAMIGSGRAIFCAVSKDEGENFPLPRALEPREGVFQMNPSIAVSATGAVLVAWSELSEEGKSVALVRLSPMDGSCCSSCGVKAKAADCCETPSRKISDP